MEREGVLRPCHVISVSLAKFTPMYSTSLHSSMDETGPTSHSLPPSLSSSTGCPNKIPVQEIAKLEIAKLAPTLQCIAPSLFLSLSS